MEGDFGDKYIETEEKTPSSSSSAEQLQESNCNRCNCSNQTIEKSEESKSPLDEATPPANTETVNNDCQCGDKIAENTQTEATTESDFNFMNYGQGRSRSRTPAVILSKDGKKPKLRTSKDVYDRLTWDSASVVIKTEQGEDQEIDMDSVFVGYKDRFLGMCELPFDEFEPGGEIPFHRVYYFRTGGPPVEPFIGQDGEVKVSDHNLPAGAVFVWDRESRTDLVFKSGNSIVLKR